MTRVHTALKRYTAARIVAGINVAAVAGPPDWPRLIRTTDIEGPAALSADVVRVDPALVGDLNVQDGDLLFSRTGSLGTVYLADDGPPSAFAGYLVRVRVDQRVADPRFLGYWGESSHAQQQIAAGAIRSTIDNFNARKVSNLRVPSLPVDQQRAIADFLDSECRRLAALHARLEVMAERAAQAREIESHETLGFDRYASVQIRYVARTGTGHTPLRSRLDWWEPRGCTIPWFTLADVHQIRDDEVDIVTATVERISALGLTNSSAAIHPCGTVLLSRTASVGFSAIMGVDMAVSQDFMTWTCGPRLEPRYLLHALRASRNELRRLMHGSTHKTIYMPDLLALRVPLPSREDQLHAVSVLDDLSTTHRAAVRAISKMRARLAEYRDALITEAVTGQIDVTAISASQMDERLHEAAEAPTA